MCCQHAWNMMSSCVSVAGVHPCVLGLADDATGAPFPGLAGGLDVTPKPAARAPTAWESGSPQPASLEPLHRPIKHRSTEQKIESIAEVPCQCWGGR